MSHQNHFNYPYFKTYYQDPRQTMPTSNRAFENCYSEEQDLHQEYNFLPKQVSYDTYMCSPLHPTRQSTDVTETNDSSPFIRKGYSPNSANYQNLNTCVPQTSIQNQQGNKGKFVAVFGASTGIAYSSFGNSGNPIFPQENPVPQRTAFVEMKKMQAQRKTSSFGDDQDSSLEREDQQEPERDFVINSQLKNLLEANIWCKEKDHLLLKLGAQYKCDWKKTAKRFNHKKLTPHFLKMRYKELTCAPIQRRIKFNHKEDLMIAKYFDKYGSNWAQMATHFHDRTAIMLKNRYYSYIRKREILEPLLNEVKELEKGEVEVDNLSSLEAQETDESQLKRETKVNSGLDSESESQNGVVTESIFHDETNEKISSGIYYENQHNPIIFNYNFDAQKVQQNEAPQAHNQTFEIKDTKEVDTLKAKVKSLQALYLKTKTELERCKAIKQMKQ